MEASVIADEALSMNYDKLTLIYNKYKSAVAYETSVKDLVSEASLGTDVETKFELDEAQEELMRNFSEFMLASQVYNGLLENGTTEVAQRMSAMENASKNAGEMILSLTTQYNRQRQAAITTELNEIISGAESLKG